MLANSCPAPLIVPSCDKYADVWPHFFRLLELHWPDCPHQIFLGTNFLLPTFPGVTPIAVGPDSTWSSGVRRMLDGLLAVHPGTDYIVLLLEDFFLKARVSTPRVVELERVARQNQLGCLRLVAGLPLALPPTYQLATPQDLGVVAKGEPYRVSLQAAIWRVETLRRLLAPGLNVWEFEEIGTHISGQVENAFWAVTTSAIDYDHAIEKGKWKPTGLAILRQAGVEPGAISREVFSESELSSHYARGAARSALTAHRSAALRSFLAGHRSEGLRHIWIGLREGRAALIDLVLGLLGSLGAAVTRAALAVYIGLRLRLSAWRERQH